MQWLDSTGGQVQYEFGDSFCNCACKQTPAKLSFFSSFTDKSVQCYFF
jgi:hypothetical protein